MKNGKKYYVWNEKGGVGKTTIVLQLVGYYSEIENKTISLLDKFVMTEQGQGYVEANAYSKTLQSNQKFYKKMFACPQELKDEMDKYITGSQNRAAGLLKFALDELKKQEKDLILY